MPKLKVAFVASLAVAVGSVGLTIAGVSAATPTLRPTAADYYVCRSGYSPCPPSSFGPASALSFTKAVYSSTLVGPGKASMYPVDVTASSGYYFVLDAGGYRIVAVNRSTHNMDCSAGGVQGKADGQIGDARALDFDAANNTLYVADTPNNRIEIFNFSASACATNSPNAIQWVRSFGTKGTGNEQFSQVYGVAVDPVNQWVYAVDGAGRVEKSNLDGSTYLTSFGTGKLNQPRQVAVAPNTDVFVMNARNHVVDVYSSAGAFLLEFGGLGKGNGQFTDDPRGIAISADGTLAFATDSGGKRVEAFTVTQSGGHYSAAAWKYNISSGTGAGTFVGPRGLTTTSDNHLMLSDEWGFNMHEFTFTSTSATSTVNLFGTPPPVPGVNSPRGVRVAANGQIYIVDYWNQRVEYMSSNGTGAKAFGFRGTRTQPGAINFAWDAALQPGTGNVFLANRESHQIEVFSPTGTFIAAWGTRGSANGQFTFPQGVAFGPDGNLYVGDSGNSRIERFTISSGGVGSFVAAYGSPGTSGAGLLNVPTGIAIAPDGTLWVADTLNNTIQSKSPSGTWTKFPSNGMAVPWGVTVAPDGNIWVSDTGSNRIVAMTTAGSIIFSATGAQLGVPGNQTIFPFAMSFDTSSHVYLSDIWNNRVLVLTAS
ncbi:MAG: hypothetical protein M3069_19420 [Chloroflexota bacterium]|nr:hypothetical protein [Chloroflexota bacterium]